MSHTPQEQPNMKAPQQQPPSNQASSISKVEAGSPASSLQLSSTSENTERRSNNFSSGKIMGNPADKEFMSFFRLAQEAIHSGVQPDLIAEGSSGSYFVKDSASRIVGVFKPKDEEPFAPLNPKWPKFFQRVMCFCCFGRACLIPNAGYLSETGASVVDAKLQLNIVPKTRVVKLASPSFFYSRRFCCIAPQTDVAKLPPKEGSFQLFVRGYESADAVLARWDADPTLLTPAEEKRFILLFQKMVVLDYIIRNTDRHTDNWLIRHDPGKELELAAIDNGLAFPIKHPEVASRLRRFPFMWQNLKYANEPWDETFRQRMLIQLSPSFVHDLCKEIKSLFRHDRAVDRPLVYNQLRVLRGQLFNLRRALERGLTPAEMARLDPLLAKTRYRRVRPSPTEDPGNWTPYFKIKNAWEAEEGCCLKQYCCCNGHFSSINSQGAAQDNKVITAQPKSNPATPN